MMRLDDAAILAINAHNGHGNAPEVRSKSTVLHGSRHIELFG
ncbi:MAG TPA: hypothetical protein VF681_05405 [Abditibacteriaceae bacterium]